MTIIHAEGISKVYKTPAEEVCALKKTTFQVDNGDFIIINGPSGSGKTTLLNLISGIDEPTEGEIFIEEISLRGMTDQKRTQIRREKIGLIFQSFELIPVLSAWENVEYPLLLQKVSKAERKEQVDQILEQVGLADVAHRLPSKLSGGQKQRIAIARALVTRPRVVLADEPTGNLDTETGQKIFSLMCELNQNNSVSFVIVTHDLALNSYARKLYQLRDGQLTLKGGNDHV